MNCLNRVNIEQTITHNITIKLTFQLLLNSSNVDRRVYNHKVEIYWTHVAMQMCRWNCKIFNKIENNLLLILKEENKKNPLDSCWTVWIQWVPLL